MDKYDMIIDGQITGAESYIKVLNPATEEPVGQCPAATAEHLDLAVTAARKAFKGWSETADDERKSAIMSIAKGLEESANELAELVTLEQGKPLAAYGGKGARFEVMAAIKWCQVTAGLSLPDKVVVDDEASQIKICRKPLGVVGSITPWNWPLMIAIWHVIPALRAGNTVVIKPSSLTPLSTLRFVEIANRFLPKGVLNIVTGEGGMGSAMSRHSGIDKLVFTGSTPTGKSIMEDASSNLKRLTLELGGNDAAIILPDVDVNKIAPQLLGGAFSNSGQTCGAIKRLYVHDDIYDEMCDALVKIVKDSKVGNGLEEGVDFGPVQNAKQLKFVQEIAESAKADGGRFLTGGDDAGQSGTGYFFPLTLVADISDGSRLVDEEPFGPILPIIRYSDVDEVIERANANPNGLGGSVWSSDVELATRLSRRLECGSAWVNCHGQIRPDVPFGGVKQSGFGVEFGLEGLEEYTSVQVVNVSKGL